MSTLFVETYANRFGTLNPGDRVAYAGTSKGITDVKQGRFAGVYKNARGRVRAIRVEDVYENETGMAILPLKRVFKF